MCDGRSHRQENTLDPLTEFLAPLLADIPDVLPTPITTPISLYPSLSAFAFTSTPASASASYHAPNPHLACQWVSPNNPPLICSAQLSQDPKLACNHFRHDHNVCGNEKAYVYCHWRNCNAPPMLRGSLIRHVLAVHLGLLKWQCEVCGKVFSRKATGHACVEDG